VRRVLALAAICSALAGAAVLLAGGGERLGTAPWIGIGAALALSAGLSRSRDSAKLDECERHLMRCRRRGEPATVLVVRVQARRGIRPERLLRCFRLTDSVAVRRTRHGYEVQGVFDDAGLACEGLERRVRELTGPAEVSIGWARFPDDGVTLPVLVERAHAAFAPLPERRWDAVRTTTAAGAE
jgi:hypothetical protein